MALFPYQRLSQLFNAIREEMLPQDELAKRLAVSTRTIRTDVTVLNEILLEYGARVIYERGHGYGLKIEDAVAFARLPVQSQRPRRIPRTARERMDALLLKFLRAPQAIKLDDIAEEWFVSRATIQSDLLAVRERLQNYQLSLENIPRQGLRLSGGEHAVRTCITDLLWQHVATEDESVMFAFMQELLRDIDLAYIEKVVQNSTHRFDIRLTNEGRQYLILNCAVIILRITWGHELLEFEVESLDDSLQGTVREIAQGLAFFLGSDMSATEEAYLSMQIAAHRIPAHDGSGEQDCDALVEHILSYINTSYNYDLRGDHKLRTDLSTHLAAMLSRIRYQVSTTNPLLSDIKQYYPFAYDVALSAMTSAGELIPYPISEDEIGYIAVHIGVGLERTYSTAYTRHPQVLIVCDAGNATLRMIEAKITRDYPQIKLQRFLSQRDYEALEAVEEDFVITTVRLSEKNKPIVKIAPFPTPYQLEQIGRLVMVDRTKPYILERFFHENHFMIVNSAMTQEALFREVCQQLQGEGCVPPEFYSSLVERESIVSTLLGENIALPHTLGLIAHKTAVVTILAPQGIEWNRERKETAQVIFLLAICKDDYEEAMAIYDLFVTFVREKATKRLLNSKNFNDFQVIAKDSLGRSS